MNTRAMPSPSTAAELARAFDASFAAPAAEPAPAGTDYVLLDVGERSYALAMTEISGLVAAPAVAPCPGQLPAFVGLMPVRGAVVPVFDLGVLQGRSRSRGGVVALARDAEAAFAADDLRGHLRVAPSAEAPEVPYASPSRLLLHEGRSVPVIDLDALIADLGRRSAAIQDRGVTPSDRHKR